MGEQSDDTAGDKAPAPASPRTKSLISEFDKWGMEYQKLMEAKEQAEKTVKELSNELEKQYSKQWELENKCKDHTHALEVLEQTLEKSIPLEDWITPPERLRTALEVAQEAIKAQKDARTQSTP
ncbi:hypothetical protein F5Y14DRAFT_416722 [Nemania sp. NC0429]|nr:hypothetical protein F5Y14DRAFT_416722 [Nemania sp. NC0429]